MQVNMKLLRTLADRWEAKRNFMTLHNRLFDMILAKNNLTLNYETVESIQAINAINKNEYFIEFRDLLKNHPILTVRT